MLLHPKYRMVLSSGINHLICAHGIPGIIYCRPGGQVYFSTFGNQVVGQSYGIFNVVHRLSLLSAGRTRASGLEPLNKEALKVNLRRTLKRSDPWPFLSSLRSKRKCSNRSAVGARVGFHATDR